jgi:hypothetical protein
MYRQMVGWLCEWLIKNNVQWSGRGLFWRQYSQRLPEVNEKKTFMIAFLQGENLMWSYVTWKQDTVLLLVVELFIVPHSHE